MNTTGSADDFRTELQRVCRIAETAPQAKAEQWQTALAEVAQRLADVHADATNVPRVELSPTATARASVTIRAVAEDAIAQGIDVAGFHAQLVQVRRTGEC